MKPVSQAGDIAGQYGAFRARHDDEVEPEDSAASLPSHAYFSSVEVFSDLWFATEGRSSASGHQRPVQFLHGNIGSAIAKSRDPAFGMNRLMAVVSGHRGDARINSFAEVVYVASSMDWQTVQILLRDGEVLELIDGEVHRNAAFRSELVLAWHSSPERHLVAA